SEELIEPLIRAGREALARKFRVEAFTLFRRIVDLSEQYNKSEKSQGAIAKTGIASLHLRVGELDAARRFLDEALAVDTKSISTLDLGWVYHVSADTHLAMENWTAANEDYTQAYGLYEAFDEYSRDLRSILKQLVKVSHKMGRPERAIQFCQMYAQKRDWGSRMLYDPSEKITAWRGNNVVPVATVGVEYTINSNCRAVDVVVTRDGGMDAKKIKKIVQDAYWLPRFRDGEFTQTGLQRISSFIINE
ncbi:MAG: tetratricopeptide repeat protein, partial [Kordiimonas sp.]